MEQKKMFQEGENKDSVIEDEHKDYSAEIFDARRNIENAVALESIIKELLNDYNLSYIELDREISVAKVCDIFTHINSKGVPLKYF